MPGLPTITYGGTIGSTIGLDGEGRITQITASTGANPVTGVTYSPYATPPQTTVTFGSGDSDNFQFDVQTGRATQYKFNVGTTQSMTGALTWNANSTLKQLAITDPFNSGDTQTCIYGYDDLTRLTSANCGTPWSGTYTFDAFGNLAKSGSMNFAASYSNSTNRMTLVGTFTPTYDANGSVLNDGAHTYTWDADGNSITADGVGVAYDAMDRAVEQNRSGSYTQIVYGPGGDKLALMNAQSLVKAFVPLNGGATAVYTSAGLDHYRHTDWLGSNRLSSTPSRTVQWSGAYGPWGEVYASSPSGSSDPSFTGQNSDTSTTGEYDFLYRQYGTQGRWPTPDPAGLAAVSLSNPQSWNRYAYVNNNPLALVDALGLSTADMACPENISPGVVISGYNGYASTGDFGFCGSFPDPGLPPDSSLGFGNFFKDLGPSNPALHGCTAEYISCTYFMNGTVLAQTGSTTGYYFYTGYYDDSNIKLSWYWAPVTISRWPRGQSLDTTLDDRVNALAQALNNTRVQSLTSPCTPAQFYLESASLALPFGAAAKVGGEALFPATRGAVAALKGSKYVKVALRLSKTLGPFAGLAAGAAKYAGVLDNAADKLGKKVQEVCTELE